MLEQLLPGFSQTNRLLIAGAFGLVILFSIVRIVMKRMGKRSVSRPARPKKAPTPATITTRPAVQMETKPVYSQPTFRPPMPDVGGTWRGTPIADDSDYVFGGATASLAEMLPES